ncbi:radical SAM/SPASM domain-containing protein [Bacilliculturomica massiliensis]|uniref:radical SAM/SPASM domain-containing protein n=1 Tax=Bacilliculturomica massiliensis TaxID=1917867 RepID=UPI001031CC80|nr:radical SAM protein [Bacilliculturomica massiliensis]
MVGIKYGFYDRLTADFPSQIIVDVTENCNYACAHCPHANFAQSSVFTGAQLSLSLHNQMIDEVKAYGRACTQQIRYTANGEPLLHPQIFDMLEYSVNNSGTFVSLTTNGSLLNERNCDKLLNININLIDVSLDANSKETYEKIRINGDFDRVKENVLNLINIKKERKAATKIVVSFVVQPLNLHEAKQFEEYWYSQGVDYVVMRKLHTAAGANHMHISDNDEQRKPCIYPWERIVLSAKGELGFCPNSWEGKSTICQYDEKNSIHKLWKSDIYAQLRNEHLNNQFQSGHVCTNCEDWKAMNWPGAGRGYGDMIKDFRNE